VHVHNCVARTEAKGDRQAGYQGGVGQLAGPKTPDPYRVRRLPGHRQPRRDHLHVDAGTCEALGQLLDHALLTAEVGRVVGAHLHDPAGLPAQPPVVVEGDRGHGVGAETPCDPGVVGSQPAAKLRRRQHAPQRTGQICARRWGHENPDFGESLAEAANVAGDHRRLRRDCHVEHAALIDDEVGQDDDVRQGEQGEDVIIGNMTDKTHVRVQTGIVDLGPKTVEVALIAHLKDPEDPTTHRWFTGDHYMRESLASRSQP
jgi:hypothetical protein